MNCWATAHSVRRGDRMANPIHASDDPNFVITSKRRKGFPCETQVKRGARIVGAHAPQSSAWRFVEQPANSTLDRRDRHFMAEGESGRIAPAPHRSARGNLCSFRQGHSFRERSSPPDLIGRSPARTIQPPTKRTPFSIVNVRTDAPASPPLTNIRTHNSIAPFPRLLAGAAAS